MQKYILYGIEKAKKRIFLSTILIKNFRVPFDLCNNFSIIGSANFYFFDKIRYLWTKRQKKPLSVFDSSLSPP